MDIDVRTIIIIIGIAHLMQIMVFILHFKANRNIKGPGWWLMWSSVEFVGFSLMLLRGIPSLKITVILFQNIFVLAGPFFIYIGVRLFLFQKVNYKAITSIFVAFIILHLFFAFGIENINARSFVLDIFLSAIAFLTANTIIKHKTKSINVSQQFSVKFILKS